MTTREAIQRSWGTTAEHATFAGLENEITIDTDKRTVVVHDGETEGGFPLARESALAEKADAAAVAASFGDVDNALADKADAQAVAAALAGKLDLDGLATAFASQTFTPTITFNTPGDVSVSYSTQEGRYWKIGDLVIVIVHVQGTPTYTTAAGQLLVAGLPFAAASPLVGGPVQHGSNLAYPSGATTIIARPVAGQTHFNFFGVGSGTAGSLSVDEAPSGQQVLCRTLLVYRAAS